MNLLKSLAVTTAFLTSIASAVPPSYEDDPFRQLEEILPTANSTRTASGAPGESYWQQRADYDIKVALDDKKQRIRGEATISYQNNSPHTLDYLWLQLDQNRFAEDADAHAIRTAPDLEQGTSFWEMKKLLKQDPFKGGYKIWDVQDTKGNDLEHAIIGTMMRIVLPKALKPGGKTAFKMRWGYNIVDANKYRARGGYEYFYEDDNYIYEIAQWFPRMAAYTDYTGWQHKQFLGRGEFTLEFGDYKVAITVPADHVVASTGSLQNPKDVLTEEQRKRLKEAENVDTPMFIITPEEAKENEKSRSKDTKTWVFKAENVRDFAWASSRKFIWDAQLYKQKSGDPVWAMSYYPDVAEPLWSKYSTHSIIHTLEVFSKYTFDYPYPVAISINGPVFGMEYPMICFNGPRPDGDGNYTSRTKYALIGVVIHEVGHNYFPMIVNSDERQWTWMDEGINTFVQFLAEQEWEEKYPTGRGRPSAITGYMASPNKVPIMTNSESLKNFGANAYAKPCAALNVLRETVMGRENFDFAFKQYSQRWKFKRPTPADFFRTMEDASGVDLDWFWRGWFYTTKHVDIGIGQIKVFRIDSKNPEIEKEKLRIKRDAEVPDIIEQRNQDLPKRTDTYPELLDFYNEFDALDVTDKEREQYKKLLDNLGKDEKKMLRNRSYFYIVEFENIGGLVMPIVLEVRYKDGSKEVVRVPAEIWKQNSEKVSKLIVGKDEIDEIILDPFSELADADALNNRWPQRAIEGTLRIGGGQPWGREGANPMREAKQAEEKANAGKATPNKKIQKKVEPKAEDKDQEEGKEKEKEESNPKKKPAPKAKKDGEEES